MGKRIVSVLLCALLLCLCAGCGSYKADASFTYLLEQNGFYSLHQKMAVGLAFHPRHAYYNSMNSYERGTRL